MRHGRLLLAALALLLSASSCAYYNTFYLARKYYFRATDGQPYVVERQTGQQAQNYSKSIDYSKKVLACTGRIAPCHDPRGLEEILQPGLYALRQLILQELRELTRGQP